MKMLLSFAVGIMGLTLLPMSGALAESGQSGAKGSSQQGKGIVNERSTGNEPFTGPGASGGPMHSTPGATERSMQEDTRAQSGGMGSGEKGGSGGSETSKKSGAGSRGTGGGR